MTINERTIMNTLTIWDMELHEVTETVRFITGLNIGAKTVWEVQTYDGDQESSLTITAPEHAEVDGVPASMWLEMTCFFTESQHIFPEFDEATAEMWNTHLPAIERVLAERSEMLEMVRRWVFNANHPLVCYPQPLPPEASDNF